MPRTPKYSGGKARAYVNKWIRAQLPAPCRGQTYIEPFAGMLGVMLSRQPAGSEIASDADGRIVQWHTCIRDHTEEMAHLIEFTPINSSDVYAQSIQDMDDESLSCCKRSLAAYVVMSVGMTHSLGRNYPSTFAAVWNGTGAPANKLLPKEVRALAHRIRDVQLHNKPAEWILERTAKHSNSVVYCDPPYRSADVSFYKKLPNWAAIEAQLRAHTGFVAISGYPGEWDHLGWHRLEKEVGFGGMGDPKRHPGGKRTECLWLNREPSDGLDHFF